MKINEETLEYYKKTNKLWIEPTVSLRIAIDDARHEYQQIESLQEAERSLLAKKHSVKQKIELVKKDCTAENQVLHTTIDSLQPTEVKNELSMLEQERDNLNKRLEIIKFELAQRNANYTKLYRTFCNLQAAFNTHYDEIYDKKFKSSDTMQLNQTSNPLTTQQISNLEAQPQDFGFDQIDSSSQTSFSKRVKEQKRSSSKDKSI